MQISDDVLWKDSLPLLQPLAHQVSEGDVLEDLVLNILYFILSTKLTISHEKQWCSIWNFLKNSKFINNQPVLFNQNHPISFLPKILNKDRGEDEMIPEYVINELQDNAWSHNLYRDDWSIIHEKLFHMHTFGKPRLKSHSFDLAFKLVFKLIIVNI